MSIEVNNEKDLWPNDVILTLEDAFIDERGSIQPLVDLPMKSCVIISSKKGSIRANHYHKTDWHFCYVISGEIEYHYRPHGSDSSKKIKKIKEGELFFTPPMEDHAMVFTKDTVFLTLGRNSRKQEIYEEDIEKVELVK
jgi:dTDP-4-dehydrorhamnose 3,5-epimerase-like enzyme